MSRDAPSPLDVPVAALMRREVMRVDMDATVAGLRERFARTGLSWAPVVDGEGGVVGVVSARDLTGPRVADHDADTLRAWQFCTYRPLSVRPDETAREVARLMVERHVHHVVVADERGLAGVVSSLDLLRAVAEDGACAPGGQGSSPPAPAE